MINHDSENLSRFQGVSNQHSSSEYDKKIRDLELEIQKKDTHILRQESIIKELESQYPSLQLVIKSRLEQERIEFEAKSEKVLSVLQKKDEVIQSLESELVEYKSKYQNAKEELTVYLQRKDLSLKENIELLNQSQSVLNGRLSELQDVKTQNLNYKREIKELKRQMQSQSEVIRDLKSQLNDLSSKSNIKLLKEIAEFQKKTSIQDNKILESSLEISNLQKINEQLRRKNLELKSESYELHRNIASQEECSPVQTDVSLDDLSDLRNRLQMMSIECEHQREIIYEQTEELKELRDHNLYTKAIEESFDKRIYDMNLLLSQKDSELKRLNEVLVKATNLEIQLAERTQECDNLKQTCDSLKSKSHESDAHSWWSFIWYESKKSAMNPSNNSLSIHSNVSQQSDVLTIQMNQMRAMLHRQVVEMTLLKQDSIGKRLSYQREIEDMKNQNYELQREINKLNQCIKSHKYEKEIKLEEMAAAIRSLSSRSDIHQQLVSAYQELEAEKLTSYHHQSEIESYRELFETETQKVHVLRSEVAKLTSKLANVDILNSIYEVPGIDPASVLEVMSSFVVNLQSDFTNMKYSCQQAQQVIKSMQSQAKLSSQLMEELEGNKFQDEEDDLNNSSVLLMDNQISHPDHLFKSLDAAMLSQKVLLQKSTIKDLEFQIQTMRKEVLMLEEKLSNIDDIGVVTSTSESLRITHESLKSQHDVLLASYNTLKLENSELQKRSDDFEKENFDLKYKLREVEMNSFVPQVTHFVDDNVDESSKTIISEIENRLKEKSLQVAVLQDSLKAFEEIRLVDEQLSESNQKADVESKSMKSFSRVMKSLINRVVELSMILSSHITKISSLEQQVGEHERLSVATLKKLEKSKSQVEELKLLNQRLNIQVDSLSKELRDGERERIDRESHFKTEKNMLTNHLQVMKENYDVLHLQTEEMSRQLKLSKENADEVSGFTRWFEEVVLEKVAGTNLVEAVDDGSSKSDMSTVALGDREELGIQELLVSLLNQFKMDNYSSIASQNLVPMISSTTISVSEQQVFMKIFNVVMKCHRKLLASQHNTRQLKDRNDKLEFRLKRLNSQLKQLTSIMRLYYQKIQLFESLDLSGSQESLIHENKVTVMFQRLNSLEVDRFKKLYRKSSQQSKVISSLENTVKLLTHDKSELQNKLNQMELKATSDQNNNSVTRFEDLIASHSTQLRNWMSLELPRLLTGLPIDQIANIQATKGSKGILALIQDLGLEANFTFGQALISAKLLLNTQEQEMSALKLKYTSLSAKTIELESALISYRQERRKSGTQDSLSDPMSDALYSHEDVNKDYNDSLGKLPFNSNRIESELDLQQQLVLKANEIIEKQTKIDVLSDKVAKLSELLQHYNKNEKSSISAYQSEVSKLRLELQEQNVKSLQEVCANNETENYSLVRQIEELRRILIILGISSDEDALKLQTEFQTSTEATKLLQIQLDIEKKYNEQLKQDFIQREHLPDSQALKTNDVAVQVSEQTMTSPDSDVKKIEESLQALIHRQELVLQEKDELHELEMSKLEVTHKSDLHSLEQSLIQKFRSEIDYLKMTIATNAHDISLKEKELSQAKKKYQRIKESFEGLNSEMIEAKRKIQELSDEMNERPTIDEFSRIRSLLENTMNDFDSFRQQYAQEIRDREVEIKDVREAFDKFRIMHEEIVKSLESQLEEAHRHHEAEANEEAADHRKRLLEFRFASKTAELDAVMRALSQVPSPDRDRVGPMKNTSMMSLENEAKDARIEVAERQIVYLEDIIHSEKQHSESLMIQVRVLQEQVEKLSNHAMPTIKSNLCSASTQTLKILTSSIAISTSFDIETEVISREANEKLLDSLDITNPTTDSNTIGINKGKSLREMLTSIDFFLQSTCADIIWPGKNDDAVTSADSRIKLLLKRVNEVRKHARVELIRLRDYALHMNHQHKDEVGKLQASISENKQMLQSLREENSRKAAMISSLKENKLAGISSSDKLKSELNETKENLSRLNRAITTKDVLIKDLREKYQTLESKIEKLESLGVSVPNAEALQVTMNPSELSRHQIDMANLPIHELRHRLRISQIEKIRNKSRIEFLNEKLQKSESEKTQLIEEISKCKKQSERIESLKLILSKKETTIKQLQTCKDEYQVEEEKLRDKVNKLQEDLEKKQRTLKKISEASEATIKDLKQENHLLRIQLSEQSKPPTSVLRSTMSLENLLPSSLRSNLHDLSDVMQALNYRDVISQPLDEAVDNIVNIASD